MPKGADKRIFPRRKTHISFDLIIKGKSVPAVVTDLSLSGLGILVKGISELTAEDLDLRIADLALNAKGRIVWKKEAVSGIRIGVCLPAPLEGKLPVFELTDILLGIKRAGITGILITETEEGIRKIYFRGGEMVYAASNVSREQMSSLLLSVGKITMRQYQEILIRARETGRNEGMIMVEMRYLSPSELVRAVHEQAEAVVMNLCAAEDVNFTFREGPLPKDEIVSLKLNMSMLLYRGARKTERLNALRDLYLRPGTYLTIPPESAGLPIRQELQERDIHILSLVDRKISFRDVLLKSSLEEEETIRSIYALFNIRLLEIGTDLAAETEAGIAQERAVDDQVIPPEVLNRIDQMYQGCKSLGYHGILGLTQSASAAEIKQSYHALAKEFHPDRYVRVPSHELHRKLNAIFAYVNEAYRHLSMSGGRSTSGPRDVMSERVSSADRNRDLARAKYREGREHLAAGRHEDAMTFFGQAAYLDDTVAEYHYHYGAALFSQGKIREAEASLRKAVSLSTDNAMYFSKLGSIYLKLGFKTRARNAFEKALKVDPSNVDASEGLRLALRV